MKTASAVLNGKAARSGHVMEALVRSDLVSRRLRQGFASEAGYALRYSLAVKTPFTEEEVGPALAAKPWDGLEYVKTWHQPSPALEAAILAQGNPIGDPMMAYSYAVAVSHGTHRRCPELEPLIASNLEAGYRYAWLILQSQRFPAVEPLVARFPESEFGRIYITHILKGDASLLPPPSESEHRASKTASATLIIEQVSGRVIEAISRYNMVSSALRQAFASDGRAGCRYAKVTGRRFPEAEPAIARTLLDPPGRKFVALFLRDEMLNYVWDFVQPALSPGDMAERGWEVRWAKSVLKGTSKTASSQLRPQSQVSLPVLQVLQRYSMISKPMLSAITASPDFALIYANYVLETRFPAGEPAIALSNGSLLYGKQVLSKSDDNEAKLNFARLATKQNAYDLVNLLKGMKATDPTEDLRQRCLANLTGALCFCLLYHERLPQAQEAQLEASDRDVNEQAALDYVRDILQAPWPAFERYLARVNARNKVHAGIFARNYLSLACVKRAVSTGQAQFTPEFTQAFLTDQYTETWATYASEYETAPMTGREIQDSHVFSARLAMNNYSPKPDLDPWVYPAWVWRNDRDFDANKRITTYLQKNHPECVEDAGAGGYVHVEWAPTKAMSKAAAEAKGLTREDFVKVYGERRMDDYQMRGFFEEQPRQVKQASVTLPAWVKNSEKVLFAVVHSGLMTKRLKTVAYTIPRFALALSIEFGPSAEAEAGLVDGGFFAYLYAVRNNRRVPSVEPGMVHRLCTGQSPNHQPVQAYWSSFVAPAEGFGPYGSSDEATAAYQAWTLRCVRQWRETEAAKGKASKTASSQLPHWINWLTLVAPLDRSHLLSKQLREAMAHVPGREAELGWRVAGQLNRRFPEAEPAIAADAGWSPSYIKTFIKGPWPEAEPAIARATLEGIADPDRLSYNVIDYVMDRVQDAGEVAGKATITDWANQVLARKTSILKTASSQLDPAQIHKFRLGEVLEHHGFMTKRIAALRAPWAVAYAERTHRRFPEGEPAIARSAVWSFVYAFKVLGHKWNGPYKELAEATLFKDSERDFRTYRSFLHEAPVQAAVKTAAPRTASSQLIPKDPKRWQRLVFRALNQSGLLSKAIRAAWAPHPDAPFDMLRNVNGNARKPELDDMFTQNPQFAFAYAHSVIHGRWDGPQARTAEATIASSPDWAEKYIEHILNKGHVKDTPWQPWPEGEPALAKVPLAAYRYAKDILQRRFPAGEPAIASDPYTAQRYAYDVIDGRWPMGEAAIATDAEKAVHYARFKIKGRFPEAEPAILLSPEQSYRYAAEVINLDRPVGQRVRWPEGEPVIVTQAWSAFNYARWILGHRWPEAEQIIRLSGQWDDYVKAFPDAKTSSLKTASSELPQTLFFELYKGKQVNPKSRVMGALIRYGLASKAIMGAIRNNPCMAVDYAHRAPESRPELEPTIMAHPGWAYFYAFSVLRHRWPEAEPVIGTDPRIWGYYTSVFPEAKTTGKTSSLKTASGQLSGFSKTDLIWALHRTRMLSGRLRAASESYAARSGYAACWYADKILNARFPAGELAMCQMRSTAEIFNYYKKFVHKNERPELKGQSITWQQCGKWIRKVERAGQGKTASAQLTLEEFPASFLGLLKRHGMVTKAMDTAMAEGDPDQVWRRLRTFGLLNVHGAPLRLHWPETEAKLLGSKHAIDYATLVIHGPWPEAEAQFAQSALWTDRYAVECLKDRFPAGEPVIADVLAHPENHPIETYNRAVDYFYKVAGPALHNLSIRDWVAQVLSSPGKQAAKTASAQLDPTYFSVGNLIGVLLTHGMLTNRLKQEFLSAADPADAINAARAYGRAWPEVEPTLLRDPIVAAEYADEVLKARWPLAEQDWHRRVHQSEWVHSWDLPYYVVAYHTKFIPQHADTDAFGGAWLWLQGKGKQASTQLEAYVSSAVYTALRRGGFVSRGIKAAVATNRRATMTYIRGTQERFPEGEHQIAKNGWEATYYARDILKHRWPEAEPAIAELALSSHTDRVQAVLYYQGFIGNQFSSYADVQNWATEVLSDVIRRRKASTKIASSQLSLGVINGDHDWDTGVTIYGETGVLAALRRYGFESKAIVEAYKSNPSMLLDYIYFVRKHRWPEVEPILMKNEAVSSAYAELCQDHNFTHPGGVAVQAKTASSQLQWDQIVNADLFFSITNALQRYGFLSKRIMAAIAGSPTSARLYARDFIKGRWPEAEPVIASDPGEAYLYAANEIRGPWPEGEPSIFTSPKYAAQYAAQVLKGPWPAAEPVIARGDDWAIGTYTRKVLHFGFQMDRDVWVRENLAKTPVFAPAPLKRTRKPKQASTQLRSREGLTGSAANVLRVLDQHGMVTKAIKAAYAANGWLAYGYAATLHRRWDPPFRAPAEQAIAHEILGNGLDRPPCLYYFWNIVNKDLAEPFNSYAQDAPEKWAAQVLGSAA